METLKILVFNWRDIRNPEAGGAEVFTHENAKRWAKAGHEVTIFTSEFQNCMREESIDEVRIIRAGGRYSVYSQAKKYYRNRFSREGYNAVIDEINTRPFFVQKFVEKRGIVALIHQLAREYWFYEVQFPLNYMGYHFLEDRWLRNYVDTPTVTVSESTRRDLADLGFRQIYTVPEGLSFEPMVGVPEKESYPVIVYVGRLTKAKRPDHALKAFEIIKEDFPEAEFWVIGDGYLREDLENLQVRGTIFFRRVSETKKIELMKRSWVLVNPSVREGFGLNVIEANACGTPCVAYDVPGLRDSIKDGETGLLVKSCGATNLASAMERILEEDVLRRNLSDNALRYSKQFSWDSTAEEMLKIIKNLTEN